MLPGEGFTEEEIDVRKHIRMRNMLPGDGSARAESAAIVRIQEGNMGHQEGRNRGYLSGKYWQECRGQEKLRSHVLE